jgi:hypothetical protein
MTPKEKAEELILKFMRLQEPNYNWFHKGLAKQCALIAIVEIINSVDDEHVSDIFNERWQQVKKEINKL